MFLGIETGVTVEKKEFVPITAYRGTGRLRMFTIFGKRHLDYLVSEFTTYYNTRRAHLERDHLPPIRDAPKEVETVMMDQIEVKSYVGGLVKSFERKAA